MGQAEFDAGQRALLERIARADPLPVILDSIVRLIERQADGLLCSILLVDAAGQRLRHGASPSLPAAYSRAIDGMATGANEGSCGAAAFLGKPVVVEDIATHPNWDRYRALALPVGLRACWSTPILSREREVLGTFAVYYREPRPPHDSELAWVAAATSLAAIALLRHRAEEDRQRLVHLLGERVRALTLLQECSRLLQTATSVDRDCLSALVELLPKAAARPGPCAARIRWMGHDIQTPLFTESPYRLEVPLVVGGHEGTIAIAVRDERPFAEEERELLSSVAAMVSTHLDRAQTVAALRRSEERLRAVVEHTPDVSIQWFDAEGRILWCNRASERTFGWEPGTAIGKSLLDLGFFDAAEEERFAASRRAAARGDSVEPVEFRYRRPDGSTGFLVSTVFQIPLTTGERCYVCMDIDVTDLRRMEETVRASEALRASLYDLVDDGIFFLSNEGERRYRFRSVNPAFLDAIGRVEADVVSRSIAEVLPEPSLAVTLDKLDEAIRTGRRVSWEQIMRAPTGIRHWEVTVSPVRDARGEVGHLLGTLHDVTARRIAEEERRRLEREIQQGQRLQSLGTLAASIAHDFNNALTAIQANAELALLDIEDRATCRRRIVTLQGASRQASDLVRTILAFSGQRSPQRETLDPRVTVEEALALVRVALPPNVELRHRFEAVPPLEADPVQIRQAVVNLLTNGLHALGRRGGVVEVELSAAPPGASVPRTTPLLAPSDLGPADRPPDLPAGDYVRLVVRDDGCGMSEATMKRAFDPFFTTKPAGEGTGLGLATVHGIVKDHGGAVRVHSQLGAGTTFTVFLPAAATPPHVASQPSPEKRRRVLLVDDEEAFLILAQRLLVRLGHQVVAHADPRAALDDFRADPSGFDLVVTDNSMPVLSGLELASTVLSLRRELTVVLLTGFVRDEDWTAAERLGIRHVLPKPLTMDELARALTPLLRESA